MTNPVSKALQPNDQRHLDVEAVHVFRGVAAEFGCLSSATKEKSDAERHGAVMSDPAVTAILADIVGLPRGQICSATDDPRQRADAFAAHLVWLFEAPLLPGRGYLLKAGAQTIGAMVTELKYRLDIETFEHLAAKQLLLNEIAFGNVATAEPIAFDPYQETEYRRIYSGRPP